MNRSLVEDEVQCLFHLSCHLKFKSLECGQNADKWDDFDINFSCGYELFRIYEGGFWT